MKPDRIHNHNPLPNGHPPCECANTYKEALPAIDGIVTIKDLVNWGKEAKMDAEWFKVNDPFGYGSR